MKQQLKDITFTFNGEELLFDIEGISYDDTFLHIESEGEIIFVPLKEIDGIITVTKEEADDGSHSSTVSNLFPVN